MADWLAESARTLGKTNIHAQRRLRDVREHFDVQTSKRDGEWVYQLAGRRRPEPDSRAESVIPRLQAATYAAKGRFCQMCGRGPADGVKLTITHKVPRSWGGADAVENLEPLCVEHARGMHEYLVSLAPYAEAIQHASAAPTPWERLGELLRVMKRAGQFVPADLLAVVARDTNRGDPARRLRDLRVVLGWDIRAHKRRVGEATVVEYELVADRPWPTEGAKEAVNAYERARKRRKAGNDGAAATADESGG
jgi:5-methylcytosine-specific restriction endonuclease McrA